MSKFQVGEIAVFAADPTSVHYIGRLLRGDEVEVVSLNPRIGGRPSGPLIDGVTAPHGWSWSDDYECRHASGFHFIIAEKYLRKRRPPGADIVREFTHELPREVTA